MIVMVEACPSNAALCLVWCTWVYYKWRSNEFNLSRVLTRSPHWKGHANLWVEVPRGMSLPWPFCDLLSRSGDKRFLVFQMTPRGHVLKEFYDFFEAYQGKWQPYQVCSQEAFWRYNGCILSSDLARPHD